MNKSGKGEEKLLMMQCEKVASDMIRKSVPIMKKGESFLVTYRIGKEMIMAF